MIRYSNHLVEGATVFKLVGPDLKNDIFFKIQKIGKVTKIVDTGELKRIHVENIEPIFKQESENLLIPKPNGTCTYFAGFLGIEECFNEADQIYYVDKKFLLKHIMNFKSPWRYDNYRPPQFKKR